MGGSDAGPDASVLSLTAWSLLVLHSCSAGARVHATSLWGSGTALGSPGLGQQGQLHLPAINDQWSGDDSRHTETQRKNERACDCRHL